MIAIDLYYYFVYIHNMIRKIKEFFGIDGLKDQSKNKKLTPNSKTYVIPTEVQMDYFT